jgi:radical SAM-linked protein
LAVGVSSQWELFDIELVKILRPHHVREALQEVLPEGLRVIEVFELPLQAPPPDEAVAAQRFRVSGRSEAFRPPHGVPARRAHRRRLEALLARSSIPYTRKKGQETVELDLRPFIESARVVDAEDDWLMVELVLPFSRSGSAKAHEVLDACYGLGPEELATLEVEKVGIRWRDKESRA